MAPELPIAVCDACVLYPFHLRNILIQVAVDGLYEAHWTDQIHEEWIRNLLVNVPSIPPERLQTTRRLMEAALPTARIDQFYRHLDRITLPDVDDRHAVAAAIEARASHILTWNLRDFDARELKKHGLVCSTPDMFLIGLYNRMPEAFVASPANARSNLSRSAISAGDFVEVLHGQGLVDLASRLRAHVETL